MSERSTPRPRDALERMLSERTVRYRLALVAIGGMIRPRDCHRCAEVAAILHELDAPTD